MAVLIIVNNTTFEKDRKQKELIKKVRWGKKWQ